MGKIMKNKIRKILADNSGMGTVEIILIIVVLIGLVLIFKNQIRELTGIIFQKISADSSAILA
jgi:Flp pilus assembly pilin Flp